MPARGRARQRVHDLVRDVPFPHAQRHCSHGGRVQLLAQQCANRSQDLGRSIDQDRDEAQLRPRQ